MKVFRKAQPNCAASSEEEHLLDAEGHRFKSYTAHHLFVQESPKSWATPDKSTQVSEMDMVADYPFDHVFIRKSWKSCNGDRREVNKERTAGA